MIEIENFTLIEFLNQGQDLIENYVVALSYLKPRKTKRQLFDMKLKHVELIKTTIDSGQDRDLIKIMSKVQKCTEEEVLDFPILEFFGLLKSIREQLKIIVTAEENALTPSESNLKWEAVNGGERMSKFGIFNTLEMLSGGDATKYKYYLNLSYSEVFTILLMRKTASDLAREMEKIKTK